MDLNSLAAGTLRKSQGGVIDACGEGRCIVCLSIACAFPCVTSRITVNSHRAGGAGGSLYRFPSHPCPASVCPCKDTRGRGKGRKGLGSRRVKEGGGGDHSLRSV